MTELSYITFIQQRLGPGESCDDYKVQSAFNVTSATYNLAKATVTLLNSEATNNKQIFLCVKSGESKYISQGAEPYLSVKAEFMTAASSGLMPLPVQVYNLY